MGERVHPRLVAQCVRHLIRVLRLYGDRPGEVGGRVDVRVVDGRRNPGGVAAGGARIPCVGVEPAQHIDQEVRTALVERDDRFRAALADPGHLLAVDDQRAFGYRPRIDRGLMPDPPGEVPAVGGGELTRVRTWSDLAMCAGLGETSGIVRPADLDADRATGSLTDLLPGPDVLADVHDGPDAFGVEDEPTVMAGRVVQFEDG